MPFELKRLVLFMSIAAVLSADKEHARFEPLPVGDYPNHQSAAGVTVAALPYETDEQALPAFGKMNPYKFGVLPILVVIQNDSKKAIRADEIRVEYVWPDRSRIEPTPANQVAYIHGAARPSMTPSPLPAGLPGIGRKKQPLKEWEIEGRAFAAKVIPPGEKASGFFYFQTGHRTGSTLYVSRLRELGSGEELIYFELPLAAVK